MPFYMSVSHRDHWLIHQYYSQRTHYFKATFVFDGRVWKIYWSYLHAPETLHSSNNQRSQSKKTDIVVSNTNDVVYQNCWLHLNLSIVHDNTYKSTKPDATDLLAFMNMKNKKKIKLYYNYCM